MSSPTRQPGPPGVLTRRCLLPAVATACLLSGCAGSDTAAPGTASRAVTDTAQASASPSAPVLPTLEDIDSAGATRVEGIGQPDWLVLAGGKAWAAGVGEGLGRLDGTTGKFLGSLPIPGETCLAMDVGFEAVWVGSCGAAPSVTRVDPTAEKVVATVPVPVDDLLEESSVAAGEDGVWVLSRGAGKLVRIDPGTNTVSGTFPQPAGAGAIRAAFGALWVSVPDDGSLLRLDPKTGATIATVTVGARPRFLAVGEKSVWVLNQKDGSVTRVDPLTNTVIATIPVDGRGIDGGDIAVGGGAVWARISEGLIARIDPATNAVTERFGPSSGSGSVAADASAVWVSAHDVASVWRLPRR